MMKCLLSMVLVGFTFFGSDSIMATSKSINQSRLLLKKLRGGDYAHIGGVAVVDMIMERALAFKPSLKEEKILDVGSGLGGTANYLFDKGYQKIWGIDVDDEAVRYASEEYPNVSFKTVDALQARSAFSANNFDFLYLFNVAYAIEGKELLFKELAKICAPGGILVVFDFVQSDRGNHLRMNDLANQTMQPIKLHLLRKILKKTGWKIVKEDDLSSESIDWYKKDLVTLTSLKSKLLKEFPQSAVIRTERIFSSILKALENKTLNSVVIYAQKADSDED